MERAFTCVCCGSNLRLHSFGTGVGFLVIGLGVLLPYIYFGVNTLTVISSLACLCAFFIVMLLYPLEAIGDE